MRAVMNGVMYILSPGCQWRYIPKDFPLRSTLHDYFTWWLCDGTLDRIHHALYVECREKAEREASPTALPPEATTSVPPLKMVSPVSLRPCEIVCVWPPLTVIIAIFPHSQSLACAVFRRVVPPGVALLVCCRADA